MPNEDFKQHTKAPVNVVIPSMIRGTCDLEDHHLHSQGKTCVNWREKKKEPPRKIQWWLIITIAWLAYLMIKMSSQ